MCQRMRMMHVCMCSRYWVISLSLSLYIYIHISLLVLLLLLLYIYIYIYIYTHICICVCICVYMYIYVYNIYIYTYHLRVSRLSKYIVECRVINTVSLTTPLYLHCVMQWGSQRNGVDNPAFHYKHNACVSHHLSDYPIAPSLCHSGYSCG